MPGFITPHGHHTSKVLTKLVVPTHVGLVPTIVYVEGASVVSSITTVGASLEEHVVPSGYWGPFDDDSGSI